MMAGNRPANPRVLLAITMVHFTGDFYGSFITPLFPVFIATLDLSLAQVGLIAGVFRLLMFIVQPLVGYLSDRYRTRIFIFAGLLLPVVFIPLGGIASSFESLLLCIALGSIGSSMFHPSVTGMVPVYSGRNTGLAMSIFNTAGTLAFGVGPLFITWYVATFGLRALPLTMIFGLVSLVYLYIGIPTPLNEEMTRLGFLATIKSTIGPVWKSILIIWLVMVLRSVVGQTFLAFIPVLYVGQGRSLVSAGALFSLFTVAGAISGIASGHLSDRIGFKPIFYLSHGLMTPCLIALLLAPGAWVWPSAIAAGAAVLASLPLGVVMAQKLAPKGRSMVASLMMGLAYGLGGTLAPLIGKLGDMFSLDKVLFVVAFIPLLTMPLIFFFPEVASEATKQEELPNRGG